MSYFSKSFFLGIALIFISTTSSFARSIIFLNGTSSAGKSSIVRVLLPMLEGATEVVSIDETGLEIVRQKFITEHGQAPTSDAELWSYVDILLKQDCTVFDNVAQLMYEKIRKLYMDGKNVIVDTVITNADEIELYRKSFQDIPAFTVLVYCPLAKLLQHATKRNQSEDKKEHRRLGLPFTQFFDMYKKQGMASDIQVKSVQVDILKKDLVESIVKQVKETAKQTVKDSTELAEFISGIEAATQKFFTELELDRHEEATITSKLQHNMVVNTGSFSAEECANQIKVAMNEPASKCAMSIPTKKLCNEFEMPVYVFQNLIGY